MDLQKEKAAILGGGNIGIAIAQGLAKAGVFPISSIIITRRTESALTPLQEQGFRTSTSNITAAKECKVLLICVQPGQMNGLLEEIAPVLTDEHIIISVVSGAKIKDIGHFTGGKGMIVRAMPNTAAAIGESMTCLSSDSPVALHAAEQIFNSVGICLTINEELMVPATALCACGIAFFLRAVRAASQGGIEIGFHAEEALLMAAQTAKGAAALILKNGNHPENEVDKVTTPRGCTISGLNQMEHHGFSSALIKGITTSSEKASKLYSGGN